MPRLDVNTLTAWATTAAVDTPDRLASALAAHADIGRPAASRALRRLVAGHWLVREGSRSRPRYRPGLLRQVVRRYQFAGLAEDAVWSRDFAPYIDVAPGIARMAQHACTELLDNAVSHSGGSSVTVSLRQNPQQLQLLVSDNGCGLFARLAERFDLHDPRTAMLELGKGKLTTSPDAHCGRGIFFTSRLADVFDLHANDGAFQHRGWDPDAWHASRPIGHRGTSVYAAFALDSRRSIDSVLAQYSLGGDGVAFERTVVPLKLLTGERSGLESRAQARRVAARLDQFARVDIDFNDVPEVGHSFVDELFRVQSASTAGRLIPINMSPRVRAMVQSIVGASPVPVPVPGVATA